MNFFVIAALILLSLICWSFTLKDHHQSTRLFSGQTSMSLSSSSSGRSPRAKILLLGDSLTQLSWDGWGGQLAHAYQRRADVVNRGMAGYNTDWFWKFVETDEHDVFPANVKLVLIFFGANDASDPAWNERHYVPIADYQLNLKRLIAKCRAHYGQDVAIILLSPPPVQHEQRLQYQKQRYGDKATGKLERTLTLSGEYAQAAHQVANECRTLFINLWQTMQEDSNNKDWDRFFYDGLHFTKEGNDFVARAILDTIATQLPDLAVKQCPTTGQYANSASSCPALPQRGPYHDEIDHVNPTRAFS